MTLYTCECGNTRDIAIATIVPIAAIGAIVAIDAIAAIAAISSKYWQKLENRIEFSVFF